VPAPDALQVQGKIPVKVVGVMEGDEWLPWRSVSALKAVVLASCKEIPVTTALHNHQQTC
jgi:hypothetical protein